MWRINIPRLDYDYSHAEKDYYSSGYYREAGPLVILVLKELKFARSQLYGWAERYQEKVLAGSITLSDSVQRYLQNSV